VTPRRFGMADDWTRFEPALRAFTPKFAIPVLNGG